MDQNKLYTLITGASDGFGKALAIECARRKMNLALVALPGPALGNLAKFIQKNFNVDVKIFEKDLTCDAHCYDLLLDILHSKLCINILINNAGVGNTQVFSETSPEFFKQQIKLNVLATTLLTSLFLPELKKYGPSYLLNIGSLSSFFYLPKKQVYGATKSFVFFFSKSLRHELEKDNISVSVACPGGMNTNFSVSLINRTGNYFSRISILNPEQVAPIVIDKMLKGKEVIIPGAVNRFSMVLDKLLPWFIKKILVGKLANALVPVAFPSANIRKDSSPQAA
jgi:short-subunit dehydrogenase